jgi:hypothetical protein
MNHPDFPKDTEFDLGGVLIPNGGSVTLKKEDEEAFFSRHAASVKEALSGNPLVKIEGTTELSKGGES